MVSLSRVVRKLFGQTGCEHLQKSSKKMAFGLRTWFFCSRADSIDKREAGFFIAKDGNGLVNLLLTMSSTEPKLSWQKCCNTVLMLSTRALWGCRPLEMGHYLEHFCFHIPLQKTLGCRVHFLSVSPPHLLRIAPHRLPQRRVAARPSPSIK